MRILVTGGAGFVGSNLVDRLLAEGHTVTAYDNFSTGQRAFLQDAIGRPAFKVVEGDVLDTDRLRTAVAGHALVFHLAANADVRFGLEHPRKDLEQNALGTSSVLEAMRATGVRRIVFASTGSIYGEPEVFPTPEHCPFPDQTSLYGASKLAAEGLIMAYCHGLGFQAHIFRFVSLLGERYSHGHVFDFVRKLLDDPNEVEVLGNGQQRKSYLYVGDCIDAMRLLVEKASAAVNVFNLGTNEYCTVDESLGWICARLGFRPRRRYTGGSRGWPGDSPFIFLDASRAREHGWQPTLRIHESVDRTIDYLLANRWLLETR